MLFLYCKLFAWDVQRRSDRGAVLIEGEPDQRGILQGEDSKTAAGIREVPIHPTIKSLVSRLERESKDGYLFSGLTFNKYKDRSNAIGKRFGRLKDDLGYGENHVFHSLRKTVVTILEDAGVSENLAAGIVGHEKPHITYGLYSGGASLKTKAEALTRVKYPKVLAKVA